MVSIKRCCAVENALKSCWIRRIGRSKGRMDEGETPAPQAWRRDPQSIVPPASIPVIGFKFVEFSFDALEMHAAAFVRDRLHLFESQLRDLRIERLERHAC